MPMVKYFITIQCFTWGFGRSAGTPQLTAFDCLVLSRAAVLGHSAVGDRILHAQCFEESTECSVVSLTQILRVANASNTESQKSKKCCTTTQCNGLAFASPYLHHVVFQTLSFCSIAQQRQQCQDLDAVRLDEQLLNQLGMVSQKWPTYWQT